MTDILTGVLLKLSSLATLYIVEATGEIIKLRVSHLLFWRNFGIVNRFVEG
jgi:hypothetical protein